MNTVYTVSSSSSGRWSFMAGHTGVHFLIFKTLTQQVNGQTFLLSEVRILTSYDYIYNHTYQDRLERLNESNIQEYRLLSRAKIDRLERLSENRIE